MTPYSYSVEYQDYQAPDGSLPFSYIPKTITDQYGRTIEVSIDVATGLVTEIEVPAPRDRRAAWSFKYERKALRIWSEDSSSMHEHWVWVLKALEGPDLSRDLPPGSSVQRYTHLFTWTSSDSTTGPGHYAGGQLETITYPSGHAAKFAYRYYPYSSTGPSSSCNDPKVQNPSWGVESKRIFLDGDLSNDTPSNTMTYQFSQHQVYRRFVEDGKCGPGTGYDEYDQGHWLVDPAGNLTVFTFRTPAKEEEKAEYGLLMREQYHGGVSREVRVVSYGYNLLDSEGCSDFDHAITKVTTEHLDDDFWHSPDGDVEYTTLVEDRSDFDQFGHPQRVVFSGNAVGSNKKVVVTDYASDNREAQGGECPTAVALRERWLGDVIAKNEVREIGSDGRESVLRRTVYGYDVERGC